LSACQDVLIDLLLPLGTIGHESFQVGSEGTLRTDEVTDELQALGVEEDTLILIIHHHDGGDGKRGNGNKSEGSGWQRSADESFRTLCLCFLPDPLRATSSSSSSSWEGVRPSLNSMEMTKVSMCSEWRPANCCPSFCFAHLCQAPNDYHPRHTAFMGCFRTQSLDSLLG